jgi:hypothetical protein
VYGCPVDQDKVRVVELWEDEVLSEIELQHDPKWELKARKAAALPEQCELIWEQELPHAEQRHKHEGFVDPFQNYRIPGLHMPGWSIADTDAHRAELAASIAAVLGRGIDRKPLHALREKLADMANWPKERAQARGLAFQPLIEGVLAAHGCEVDVGKHRPGEQVDLFVHRPFRALVECRWEKNPVGRPAVTELIGKLNRDRPAIVAGLYLSMSGFTREAQKEAREHSRDRVVILLDATDISSLLDGDQHVADMFDTKVDEIVRRY